MLEVSLGSQWAALAEATAWSCSVLPVETLTAPTIRPSRTSGMRCSPLHW